MNQGIVKNNFSLIIGITIPILMIIVVAASIYLPRFFAEPPQYSFLYVSGDRIIKPNVDEFYRVESGKLVKDVVSGDDRKYYRHNAVPVSELYVYDVKKNESRVISLEEAQKLNLINNNRSPDGFEVMCGRSDRGGFLFFDYYGSDCSTRYLTHRSGYKKEINIFTTDRNYYDFYLLGWIDEIEQ